MLRKFSSYLTRSSYPQRVAGAVKKIALDTFKEQNPEISGFIDRNTAIEQISSPQLRQLQYSKLVHDINNNGNVLVTGKTYTALGMADYLYKTVAISQEMQLLRERGKTKTAPAEQQEQIDTDTVTDNLRKFRHSFVNMGMQIQAGNIADLILEEDADTKTLKEKIESYAAIADKRLSPQTKYNDYSIDKAFEYERSAVNSNKSEYSESDESIVPKPHQIKTYVFSHLLKSLSQTSNNTEESNNILFAAIRRTIDSKNETIGEFQQILSETSGDLSESIIRKIKEKKEKSPDLFAPIKTVNETIKKVDDISGYYRVQAQGALLGLNGAKLSLYEDRSISFDNLAKTRKQIQSRIEIEKSRSQNTRETGCNLNADSTMSIAGIDFYKKIAAGDIPTSKTQYNIMRFISSVADLPDSVLPAERLIDREEENRKLPPSLSEVPAKSR